MTHHSLRLSSMRGFSIIHALISLVIFASVTIGGLKWQRFNASVDKGRNIGQQYLTLNAAVNNYIVTYYQSLSKLNPKCSAMAFTTVDPATPSWAQNNPNQCTLTIAAGKTVANGFQPSPAELITLGLLPLSPPTPAFPAKSAGLLQIESPDIPTAALVYEYIPRAVTPSAISQPRLFINIEMVCVQRGSATNPNTGNAVPTAPGANGCDSATTTTALKTLIFNTQPYNANQSNYSFTFPALLGSVFNTLGDDAVSSGMVDVKLVNTNNALNGKNFRLTHPIQGGPSGILGLRGGYGASYAMQHSRVDGSNPPTADWSFGAHNLNDVNILNSTTLNASGNLTVGNTASVTNNLAAGSITSPTGTITNLSATGKMHLPTKILGNPCDPNTESIAFNALTQLLICQTPNNTWMTQTANTIDFSKFFQIQVRTDLRNASWTEYFIYDCTNMTEPQCLTNSGLWPDRGVIAYNNDTMNRKITLSSFPQKKRDYFPVIMTYHTGVYDKPEDYDQGVSIGTESMGGEDSWKFDIRYATGVFAVIRLYKINK
jgi:hypothetical protein